MISTQKSRNKLLLPELFFFFFLTISQLLQEEKFRHKNRKTQKTQKLILLFFPFSTVFPPLKHKLNTNWTQTKYKFNIKKKKKKETQNSQSVLNNRRERTLRMRMDDVVKVDEMKRERGTVGWRGKTEKKII